MKRSLSIILLVSVSLIYFSSCEEKVNVEKEKEAIKNVFEQEKNAYFKQDYVGMSNYWVKDPSSVKMFLTEKGINRFDGWDKINAQNQKETSDTTWNRKLVTVNFSNYKIDIVDKCAWVLCDTHFEGTFSGQQITIDQSRIAVLKKDKNEWKFAFVSIFRLPRGQ
jgi:hypothetical protein